LSRAGFGLLLVVYAAFIAIGLPDTVLGAAWPVMHGDFGVSLGALGVLGVAGALSAVASSAFYGWLRRKPPPWVVLVGSTLLMALTMLAFGLASNWWVIVGLSVAWGLCGGGIDIELNHFAARHFSRRHMSWLHGCWGIGAAAGPLLMAGALAYGGQWQAGFWLLALVMGLLGLAFWFTRGLWPVAAAAPAAQAVELAGDTANAENDVMPSRWAVWLSPVCFFLVVAAEFATAIWIPSIMVAGHGLAPAQASQWATLFFGAMMVGRFALGAFGEQIGNRVQVRLGIAAAMVGAVVFAAGGASAAGAAGLVLMGLGSAPLFPALMHETGVRFSDAWSGRMVARQMTGAYLAGALMPLVYAALVNQVGVGAIIPTAIGLLLLLAASTAALDRATPPSR
jgi:fucose permease